MKKSTGFESYKDVIGGGFFCLLSAVYFIRTFSISSNASLYYGGSRLLPWIASGAMFLISSGIVIGNIRKLVKASQQRAAVGEDRHAESADAAASVQKATPASANQNVRKTWKVFLNLALIGAYAFFMGRAGFLASTIPFLFAQTLLLARPEQRKYVKIALISVIAGVAVYFLFTKAFSLMLPRGTWWA